jgi:hypothetical protein
MRRLILIAAITLPACKPDLGSPASLISGLRVLAVRASPPEAPPGGPDAGIIYDLLAVTPDGTLVGLQPAWAYCMAPTPPSENNLVSPLCLGPSAQLKPIAQAGPEGMAQLPSTTCQLFGPLTPPPVGDAGPGRPPDPDGTGGFYQPVRVDLPLSDGGLLTSFGEERISCGLAGVTESVATGYATGYTPNQNPVLQGVTATIGGGSAQPLLAPDAGAGFSIPAGSEVTLAASWPDGTAESFPALDPVSRMLVTQTENLITSWFVTAGSMALDEVEVPGTDTSTTASNQWTAPTTSGPVHLWVVLRDSRGGVDFGEFLVMVQ